MFLFFLEASTSAKESVKVSSEPVRHSVTVNVLSGATKLPGAEKQVGGQFFS